jgi:hypothetical protein
MDVSLSYTANRLTAVPVWNADPCCMCQYTLLRDIDSQWNPQTRNHTSSLGEKFLLLAKEERLRSDNRMAS